MTERDEPAADFLPVDAVVTVVEDDQAPAPGGRRPIGAMVVVAVIVLVLVAVVFTLLRGASGRHGDTDPPPYTAPTANLPPIDPPATGGAIGSAAARHSPSRSPGRTPSSAPAATRSARSPAPTASPTLSAAAAGPPPGSLVTGGRCAQAGGFGDQITVQTCDGGTAQRWSAPGDGAVHAAGGGCLDVRNAATTNGSPVQVYVCNRSPAQSWELRGDGSMRNPNADKCLTVAGQSLVIQDCQAAAAQLWRLV